MLGRNFEGSNSAARRSIIPSGLAYRDLSSLEHAVQVGESGSHPLGRAAFTCSHAKSC